VISAVELHHPAAFEPVLIAGSIGRIDGQNWIIELLGDTDLPILDLPYSQEGQAEK
jgi:hypothetical protein